MILIIGLFISYAYESNNSWVKPLIGYHIADTVVKTICHLLVSFTTLRYYMTSIDFEMDFIFFCFSARLPFYYFSEEKFVMLTPVQCLYYPVITQYPLCLYPVSEVQVVLLLFHYTQNRMLCTIAQHSISRLTASSKASLETFE
jgi:hypothetical protein